MMRYVAYCGLTLVCLAALAVSKGCAPHNPTDNGDTGDGADDPFASYVPDPDVYYTPPDPDRMIEQTLPGGRTFEFPVNQLILLMNEGTQRSVAEQLATALGGTIVGQVPEIDFYQLELPATTRAELDALIAQAKANPNVTSVGYNGVPQLNQTCPAQSDNADIAREDQCPFAETEYFQAVTMFDAFREHLTLHPVRVGIVDTGVDPATGEFDDVDIFYLNNTVGPPEDPHPSRHGTAVAGVIAADDDFSGVNGMASRFLQDNLHLVVGSVRSTAGFIVYTTMAASAGADVINMSFGWDTSRPDFEIMWDTWLRVMAHRSTVLFVCSAGNEMTELTGFNYAPGGIGLSNVITVAATAR
ncbi:MAG: S8/S53 family peptidase, partial [Planctomycetes bacterium]|nr:S8/S53 family peptidase [Planctomycetota bacterium]